MLLPMMFLVGMCLIDTINGVLMAWVYGAGGADGNRQRLQLGGAPASWVIGFSWGSGQHVYLQVAAFLSSDLFRYYNMFVTATSAAMLGVEMVALIVARWLPHVA